MKLSSLHLARSKKAKTQKDKKERQNDVVGREDCNTWSNGIAPIKPRSSNLTKPVKKEN